MLTQLQLGEFLLTLHNPRYALPDKNGPILLDGIHNGNILEFYASPYDSMDYGRNIYKKAIDGGYGTIGPYIHPEINEQPKLDLFAEESK